MKVRLDVMKSWKGVKTKTIEVDRWSGCNFERFVVGKEFLVYAHGAPLQASMCSRTKEADHIELESELLDILVKGGKEEPFLRRLPEVLAKDPRPSARAEAARLIVRDAPKDVAAAARPVRLRALDDPSPIVRRAVIETYYEPYYSFLVTRAPDVARALLKRLGDRDAMVRREAARVLEGFAPVAQTDRALRAALKVERDPEVISALASAIAMRGSRESKRLVLPLLVRELKNAKDSTRWNAAQKLGAIGSDAVPAIEPLAAALHDPQNIVRLYAATALGEIGSRKAVPALVAALRDQWANVRAEAALAIYKIGDDVTLQKAAMPVLIKDLQESHRSYTFRVLEELGPRAKSAIPALQELLRKTTDNSARDAINGTLEEITMSYKPEPVRNEPLEKASVLIARLNDEKKHRLTRCGAAESLRRIGTPEARAAFDRFATREIPLLVASLRDREWIDRAHAARCLGVLGPAARSAAPALTRALDDRNRYVRKAAAQALAKIR